MKLNDRALRKRAEKIRMVLTDVDGVLTTGTLYHFVDTNDELVEFKGMHAHDSIGLAWLAEAGIVTGTISGRVSKGVESRLKLLNVKHIYQQRLDKATVLNEILAKEGITSEQTAYIGDDLPDLAVLNRVGLAVAPIDARPEIKNAAHWITKSGGGAGAMRELAEMILKSKGLWRRIVLRYS